MRAEPKNTTVSRIFSRAEMRQRLQKLGQDAERPRVRAVQELLVQIGDAAGGRFMSVVIRSVLLACVLQFVRLSFSILAPSSAAPAASGKR